MTTIDPRPVTHAGTLGDPATRVASAPVRGTGERVVLGEWDAHLVHWPGDRERPVLLLHGFTAHAQSWQHLAHALAPAHDVVALDQRGHGRSAPTSRYGSRPMVADIGALLDRRGWDRVDLVGQSMGGMNAFLFAAAHPERVRRLVVVDIGPEPSAAGLARIRANAGTQRDVFSDVDDALAVARASFPLADADLLRSRIEHNLACTGDGRWTWRTARALRDGTAERDDHTAGEKWAAWAAVTAPTLLVHGAVSDVLTVDIVARMRAARPEVELVTIEGASHSVPLDRPDELAGAARRFLAGAR